MDSKRLAVAVLLSLAIWFAWMKFFAPSSAPPAKQENAVQKTQEEAPKVKPATNSVSEIKVTSPRSAKESLIEMSTDKFKVVFTNKGGAVKSFIDKERDVELVVDKNQFSAKGEFTFSMYLSKDEFAQGNNLENAIWDYTKISENAIKFYSSVSVDGKPLRLEKTYTFIKDGYYFKVDYNIINPGNTAVSFPNGFIIVSPGDFLGPNMDFDNQYNSLNQIYYLNNDFAKSAKGGGFFSKGEDYKVENGDVKWAGISSRYFLLIMLPENFNGTGVICDSRTGTGQKTGLYIHADKIQPRGKLAKSFKVYAGEKSKEKLMSVDDTLKEAMDVSKWIEPIRDFLLWCLKHLNSLIGNIGWSLVIFSILTKIVLMPLTIKSTESMRRMQALTPKMNELKEKYKGKPDVLNKEMMKLYKTNKVNPMGGCLPLILQMPFFFALWSALINSIDLWQAPFIFWIKDLSLPDTVAMIPFLNVNLNILPIIMTATSFFQQRLMPSAAGGGGQQKMMMMMPLIFIVIFWNMPSGLVLYWTLQNLMQILHQLYTNRKSKPATA